MHPFRLVVLSLAFLPFLAFGASAGPSEDWAFCTVGDVEFSEDARVDVPVAVLCFDVDGSGNAARGCVLVTDVEAARELADGTCYEPDLG